MSFGSPGVAFPVEQILRDFHSIPIVFECNRSSQDSMQKSSRIERNDRARRRKRAARLTPGSPSVLRGHVPRAKPRTFTRFSIASFVPFR